jgi:hypothetical protein
MAIRMNACPSRIAGTLLRAYQNREVKRLAVVARLSQELRKVGRFASLHRDLDR